MKNHYFRIICVALIGTYNIAACSSPETIQTVNTERYSIELNEDWIEQHSNDFRQKKFENSKLSAGLLVSFQPLTIGGEDAPLVAAKMSEFRIRGEQEAAKKFGFEIHVEKPTLTPQPWGYEISYSGADSNGRNFRYYGAVSVLSIISIYMESNVAPYDWMEHEVNSIAQSLEF